MGERSMEDLGDNSREASRGVVEGYGTDGGVASEAPQVQIDTGEVTR